MKRNAANIEEIKKAVLAKKGQRLRVSINRGRKKVERFDAEIAEVYPAVFVLNLFVSGKMKSLTASYNELICGEIKIS